MIKKILLALFINIAASVSAYGSCAVGENEIIVQIIPDNWPTEISWTLATSNGTLLASGGASGDTVCVPVNTCIEFTINDSYGDGILAPGGYWIYVDGSLVAGGNNFGFQDQVSMNCPPGMRCNSALPLNYGSWWTTFDDSWYSFTPDSSGTYNLSTCDSNACNTQLWVYTSCPPMPYTEGPMGSYAYNDDNNCALMANMNVVLFAGTNYLIRVGDNLNDCTDTVHFTFSYVGPISGCMDPNACNFNPLAAAPDTCYYFPNPNCEGPDLVLDSLILLNSLSMRTMTANNCDVAEGCVTGYGVRHVIQFTSRIYNYGTLDYYIGNPSGQPGMFNFNNCHGHAHYEGYGDYRLYDSNDFLVPAGHKNGYCVIDLCGMGQYTCGNMGISAGCYDAYGAGTQCQWVDITNVPDGDYRLAAIINSQHLPDALGRYETNFLNNATQVCIRITRNAQNIPSFSILPNCTPFVDCNGLPGGTAERDCNGVCNGTVVYGDLNSDAALDSLDISSYLDQVQSGFAATSCNDLNGDGVLSVFDVAQMNWCVYGNPAIPGGTSHNHCRFPRNVINPQDSSELSITQIDLTNNFIDVALRNVQSGVKGFQFTISGATVTSVVSLINPVVFPVDLRVIASTNEVLGFAINDSMISRSNSSQPIVRVYFSNPTDTSICISSVTAIMNENGEGTITQLINNCAAIPNTGIIAAEKQAELVVIPNPVSGRTFVHFSENLNPGVALDVMEASGRLFSVPLDSFRNGWFIMNTDLLPAGVYIIRLTDGETTGSARFVKL